MIEIRYVGILFDKKWIDSTYLPIKNNAHKIRPWVSTIIAIAKDISKM